jgi:hypothetical protein
MTGFAVLAACLALAALGAFFLAASVRGRGKHPPSLVSPLYVACYGVLAAVTAGGVWVIVSGHGSPLVAFVFAAWPFALYGVYRGERSRRA